MRVRLEREWELSRSGVYGYGTHLGAPQRTMFVFAHVEARDVSTRDECVFLLDMLSSLSSARSRIRVAR